VGTAQDIANVALFFASELSGYVTGLNMYVGGGQGYIYSSSQSFLLSEDAQDPFPWVYVKLSFAQRRLSASPSPA
jgi:hypothetical protein